MQNVMILTGAGQIGMAIARRMGHGMKIVIGDRNPANAQAISKIMNDAGFDAVPVEMDLSSRASIQGILAEGQKYGPITMLVNAAGVSPSQAPIEAILRVDLYGTAVLLEEVGKVIAPGGVGVTISSQSGHRMPALTPEEDELLACTPTEELLGLELLRPDRIRDTLHAYQLAKRCNVKRVMAQAVTWGARGARINSISPGIIVTPPGHRRVQRAPGRFLQEHVRPVPRRPAGHRRRGGQCGRAAHGPPGRLHHRGGLPYRRGSHRLLLLRPPEAGGASLSRPPRD